MENICFIDTNFISFNPLNENNIIDYFSTSPFYDPSCNNEVLKMQSQYTGNKINQQVDKLKGMYFILDYRNEDNTLFVIRKSINTGDEHVNINFYYVIFGHIYEAPTCSSLFHSKATEVFWQLNKIIDCIIEEIDFNPLGIKDQNSSDKAHEKEYTIIRDIFEMYNKITSYTKR
ncbi:Mediator of RNA polymerase II transcription subunit 6 [Nosema granulosis]|uniref:Mediator of RNA polymerase II transcription subunit 6 n=1 Tax=Nosema granulosis TaxID=83296 RepID=A0A9P6GZD4_9MICR|nr:Mediator of RNA polymerase II transcription subunit 6 [Nosema granulosis]